MLRYACIHNIISNIQAIAFAFQDNSSSGNINDAFGGSSTYQPGDTIGNTDIEVYQKGWDFDANRIK